MLKPLPAWLRDIATREGYQTRYFNTSLLTLYKVFVKRELAGNNSNDDVFAKERD